MIALRLNWLSFACFRIEKYYGKMATGSLCVTKAMQHELEQNWEVRWDQIITNQYNIYVILILYAIMFWIETQSQSFIWSATWIFPPCFAWRMARGLAGLFFLFRLALSITSTLRVTENLVYFFSCFAEWRKIFAIHLVSMTSLVEVSPLN